MKLTLSINKAKLELMFSLVLIHTDPNISFIGLLLCAKLIFEVCTSFILTVYMNLVLSFFQYNELKHGFTQWVYPEMERQHYPLGHERMRFVSISRKEW
jgi:hypothetical protein